MKRYSIKDMINTPHEGEVTSYKNQIAILVAKLYETQTPKKLFAIDAFAIGHVLKGSCTFEFNNEKSRLEPRDVLILTPTHTCRIAECDPDLAVRFLLLDSNSYNLSVHLNYIVKSETWIQTYFHPVIKLNKDESDIINECTDRIVKQIKRSDCAVRSTFIRLAITWHHMELDNIMQKQHNEITDNVPLTRQQVLARQLYRLIINNYQKEHHTKYYAGQMCMTPQYLNQITSNVFGKSLSAIISDILFSTARTMILASEKSIQEIADELNFPDQASFSKFIKKKSGISPNAMRKVNPHQESI
ncbi:MAG: AraC family transcriptional regulator [Bacteroidaceae bacterium]|nr:AraC family transcriptional regulator [Bacteroidaceae bacterium]